MSVALLELSRSRLPHRLRRSLRRLTQGAYWILAKDLDTGPVIASVVVSDPLELPLLKLQIYPVLRRHVGKRECRPTRPTKSPDARSGGSPLLWYETAAPLA